MKHKLKFCKTDIYMLIMFVLLVFIDRLTKILSATHLQGSKKVLIENVLELSYVENTGSAFGFLHGMAWIIGIISIFVILYITYLYFKIPKEKVILKALITALCAGAISNFIDRIIHGYVVDFISFVIINFPVFNFADICICVSVFFVFIYIIRSKDDELKNILS